MDKKRKKKTYSKLQKTSPNIGSHKHKKKATNLRPVPMCGPYVTSEGKVDCECVLY